MAGHLVAQSFGHHGRGSAAYVAISVRPVGRVGGVTTLNARLSVRQLVTLDVRGPSENRLKSNRKSSGAAYRRGA